MKMSLQVDQESVLQFVESRQQKGPDGDRWFVQQSTATGKFLLLLQTEHQRHMLNLYGSTVVGMDATYKTSKWGFPLFLINVVTNHAKGVPVAMFLVQEETTSMIMTALQK